MKVVEINDKEKSYMLVNELDTEAENPHVTWLVQKFCNRETAGQTCKRLMMGQTSPYIEPLFKSSLGFSGFSIKYFLDDYRITVQLSFLAYFQKPYVTVQS